MKAGFCSECATYVWLLEDGSCQHGHPRTAISAAYEVGELPLTTVPLAAQRPRSKRHLVWVIILCAIIAFGLLAAGVFVIGPLVGKGLGLAGEWKGRLAADYPGWDITGFHVGGWSGNQTAWTFTLVPPGRDFRIGVVYLKNDAGVWVPQDDILRPAGPYHERSESLLDYLERNYIAQGKDVVSVTSLPDGGVMVNWNNTGGAGPISWSSNGWEALKYDQTTESWSR